MLKIALATIFYNNKDELQRLADSIQSKTIDYWITIDGPFRYNLDIEPSLPHESDDGSLDVIMESRTKFKQGVVMHNKAGSTEFEKRNTYLENCQKLNIDVLIIVDSDEYFIPDTSLKPDPTKSQEEAWNRFIKNIELELIRHQSSHNVFGIPFVEVETKTETYKPRIWLNPGQMRYINGSHYHYANMETEQRDVDYFNQYGMSYIQHCLSIVKGGITMAHDHSLRTEEYNERRKKYQQYLVSYEEKVQQTKKYTVEEAEKLAKENPDKEFKPTT